MLPAFFLYSSLSLSFHKSILTRKAVVVWANITCTRIVHVTYLGPSASRQCGRRVTTSGCVRSGCLFIVYYGDFASILARDLDYGANSQVVVWRVLPMNAASRFGTNTA